MTAFGVLTEPASLQGEIASNCEALCRLAIGQAIRDHLYEKSRAGDAVLDMDAVPWDGELRPVGAGARKPAMTVPSELGKCLRASSDR